MSFPLAKLGTFEGRFRILHCSWLAFFISFVVWFNHAAILGSLRDGFGLSDGQIKALLILNVAITIPARIIIGMLVDAFGPKRVYTVLLLISGLLCIAFALAQSFGQLALLRFLLGFVGAGFVVGIRLISEWFPAREVGFAEGIYGGWGNFGASAATVAVPLLALAVGGDNGWRYAVASTGALAIAYALFFYRNVSDTPKGSTYFKPKRGGAMEVSNKGDFVLYALSLLPMVLALALLIWKLGPSGLGLLGSGASGALYGVVVLMGLLQWWRAWQVNAQVFVKPVPAFDRYPFKQVLMLNLAYMAAFGSEIAVISMLPLFFQDTFGLSQMAAGLVGASFTVSNLFARPGGGWIADRIGRSRATLIALAGVTAGYLLMSKLDANWPVTAAVLLTVVCSVFVQAGCGTVYAAIPLVKRRLTGQVAGMAGAYGNVGGVIFLTVLSFTSPQHFFLVIGLFSLAVWIACWFWLEESQTQTADVLPDGTVMMIEVK